MKNTKWPIIIFIFFQLLPVTSWPDDGNLTKSRGKSSTEKLLKTISIQVASHKELQGAEQELKDLKSHGLEPFMRHEFIPNKGMWYRIYVGSFGKMEDAKKFAQRIKDQGIISGFWVKRIELPFDQVKASQMTTEKTDTLESKVDAKGKKRTVPPQKAEKPIAVIPPKEEPLVTQPPVETPEVVILPQDKPSLPDTPVDIPKDITQEKAKKPVSTEKEEAKETLPPDDIKEDRLSLPVQDADEDREIGRFSLGINSSFFLAPKADEFSIKRTTGFDNRSWSFQDKIVYISLESTYRVNSALLIETGLERAFFSYLDLWHLTMGPKIEFKKIRMLTPHVKGSLVIGQLEWDEAPGDFDLAWGWESGLGISLIKSNIQFGIEASYRGIKYDYNRPVEGEITATSSQLDLSGYALSVTLDYWF